MITASDEDGGQIGRLELPSPPIFDGMAIANGKLFITLEDGSVLCLTKGNESKVSKEDEAVGASSKRKKRRR